MAETEIKNPSGIPKETQPSNELTESDFKIAIDELSTIEKRIFNGDGVIGGESNDTEIDKKYKESIEKATDIKTKIKLIGELVEYFTYGYVDYSRINQEYIDEKSKKSLENVKLKVEKLKSKFPYYKDCIGLYVSNEFALYDYTINFWENANVPKSLYGVFTNNTLDILNTELLGLEKFIEYVENNKKIYSKQSFIKSCIENRLPLNGEKFNNLMNLDFYKDNSTYKYGIESGSTDFSHINDMSNLLGIYSLGPDVLKDINNLYKKLKKDSSKSKLLVAYIDENLSNTQKQNIFTNKNIREIYAGRKEEELCINTNLIKDNNLIISLSNIKNKKLNENLQLFTSLVLQDKNNGINKMEQFISKELGALLFSSDNNDKFFIVEFIHSLNINYSMIYPDAKNEKIAQTIQETENYVNDEIKNSISKELEEMIKSKNISPDNLVTLLSNGIIKEESKGKYVIDHTKLEEKGNLSKFNSIVSGLNTHSQSIRPKEPNEKLDSKPEPQISKEKKQEMQQKIDKLGLNATVNDNGKMVGKNGEETFKQKIQNGKVEVGVNDKLIYTTALGYKFELENNDIGNDKLLEITESFSYLDRIGLGYFGNNFQEMLESIRTYLPNQASYLNIDEQSGNFLSMRELNEIIIPIFKNVGFIDNSQNLDYLAPEEVTDTVMSHRLSKINGGKSFEKGKPFNKVIFGELLQQTNKV